MVTEHSKSNNTIEIEIDKIFGEKNIILTNILIQLKTKYNNNELVEKIQTKFLEKYKHIYKKAKKFGQLIRDKYIANLFLISDLTNLLEI